MLYLHTEFDPQSDAPEKGKPVKCFNHIVKETERVNWFSYLSADLTSFHRKHTISFTEGQVVGNHDTESSILSFP